MHHRPGVQQTRNGVTKQYNLTAGHCSSSAGVATSGNTSWFNVTSLNGTSLVGGDAYLGTITQTAFNDSAKHYYDLGLMGSKAQTNQLWSGGPGSTSKVTMLGHLTALPGDQVCMDGAFDGPLCGAVVLSQGYLGCFTLSVGKVCGAILADVATGKVLVGGGDSGGPVYEKAASGANGYYVGIVSFGSSELACVKFAWRGNACGHELGFMDGDTALGYLGASLKVG